MNTLINDIINVIVSNLDDVSNYMFSLTCKQYYPYLINVPMTKIIEYAAKYGYLSLFIYSNTLSEFNIGLPVLRCCILKNHKHIIKWMLDNNILPYKMIFTTSVILSNLKIIKLVYNHRIKNHIHCMLERNISEIAIANDDLKTLKWMYKKRINLFIWKNDYEINNPWIDNVHAQLLIGDNINILRWMIKINPPKDVQQLISLTETSTTKSYVYTWLCTYNS